MTTSRKVVITDWGFESLDPEREAFAGRDVELVPLQCKTEEDVAGAVVDAEVVMTQWAPVKAHAISTMQKCRGIVRYGIGLDNIDLDAAAARGIPVRNVPDYCLNEVADQTMALILTLQRQVCSVRDLVRDGTWRITPPLPLPPLRESTLGLVGFGRIARLVAERARSFGLNIIATDHFVSSEIFRAHHAQPVDVEALFKTADIISLHCPLTHETRHLVNAERLAQMKPLALLVNTSRGGLIDTNTLTDALRENRIAGAALDVMEQEPPAHDAEILKLPNAVITSHNSWYSSSSVRELQRLAAMAALDLLG
ncbi:MAG: C-terminal binding protein [Candidatus Sumerlaeaceae bacterium]